VAGVTDYPGSKMGNAVSKMFSSSSTEKADLSSSIPNGLSAGLKRKLSASDAAALWDEEDKLDDAPGLAAFVGLRYIHHRPQQLSDSVDPPR